MPAAMQAWVEKVDYVHQCASANPGKLHGVYTSMSIKTDKMPFP